MKYLSLFTGIGGFELGIQQAYENLDNRRASSTPELAIHGHLPDNNPSDGNGRRSDPVCIGYSEIDKYAIQIYEKHFGTNGDSHRGIKETAEKVNEAGSGLVSSSGEELNAAEGQSGEYGDDVRERPEQTFTGHRNYGDITKINADALPDFDFLCGGFPCQAFSIAGKRKGFDDTRGTLFFDIARILRAKQPRLFLLENVKGLLSHDHGTTFSTIIATLDELGYDLQWQVLNSKNHGVPQNRERVFIVGHLRGTPRPKVFPFGQDDSVLDRESKSDGGRSQAEVSHTLRGSNIKADQVFIRQLNDPIHSNDRVYGADGISPTLNTMQGGLRQPFVKIPEATKKGYAEATVGQSINLAVPTSTTRRGRVSNLAQTIDTGMQQHTLTSDARIRRLTPMECERLQGFPDGWTDTVSDTQRYKTLGNAVTVNVIQDVVSRLLYSYPHPS